MCVAFYHARTVIRRRWLGAKEELARTPETRAVPELPGSSGPERSGFRVRPLKAFIATRRRDKQDSRSCELKNGSVNRAVCTELDPQRPPVSVLSRSGSPDTPIL
jgi:hypothetical protein